MEIELLEKIGDGATTEIYKVRVPGLPQPFLALKRLKEECAGDRHFTELMEAEARTLARLSHPGLPRFFFFITEESNPGIILDYIQGWNVKTLLEKHREQQKRPRSFLALWLASQLCHTLHYLHGQGIVHADINPKNLMLSGEGQFKLLDLGIAQSPEARFGEVERVGKGSISYMAPEQALGTDLDARSDLFSVGIVLYEMLCGERPFQGQNRFEVEQALLEREITAEALPDRLDPRLAAIVVKALAKDPARRFQNAGEFAQALATYQSLRYPGLIAADVADLLNELSIA